jgi:uncharacterized membrane protein YphA (DoxX/SURF4 family)
MSPFPSDAAVATLNGASPVVGAGPKSRHVDYVTGESTGQLDSLAFVADALSNTTNVILLVGGVLAVTALLAAYFRLAPHIEDIVILRQTLVQYDDLIPWMLRLSIGLPLVGAGFIGYLFSPSVPFDQAGQPLLRVGLIGLGFLTLFGLATRIVSSLGLAAYLITLAVDPVAILAVEYVPGFLALIVLGGGRPSADHMLQHVASADGTLYGRVDPVHRLKRFLDDATRPYRRFVPVILRLGLGVSFIYLGLIQKLGNPAQSLAVVEKYNLTAVVPVEPELWVLGAGLTEMAVGLALIAGVFTRASAALAFGLFTLTLFGLPDDPVLAHISLFGMASALFITGAGPWSFDNWTRRPAVFESEMVVPGT